MEMSINCENIDTFNENPDNQRLQLVYHMPQEGTNELVKKSDTFDCAENDTLLKTF